jgi:hypothetical protein
LAEVASQPQAAHLSVALGEPENHPPSVVIVAVVNDDELGLMGEPTALDDSLDKSGESSRGAEGRDHHRHSD